MKLKLLNFVDNPGNSFQWQFDKFSVLDRNLIVGVNASGKSRILSAIDWLAQLLSKRSALSNFPTPLQWHAEFLDDNGGSHYTYDLEINHSTVVSELFAKDGKPLLKRLPNETSTIWSNEKVDYTPFQTDENELAAVAKRDKIQNPFLDPLYLWGQSVHFFPFGTPLGQGTFGFQSPDNAIINIDQLEHDPNAAVPKFAVVRSGTHQLSRIASKLT